jgi:hypothetical protein
MSTPEPTEVEIRVSEEGRYRPLRFRLGEVWLDIGQIGKTWTDDAGEHFLVMPMYPPQLFDLTRGKDGRWLISPYEVGVA